MAYETILMERRGPVAFIRFNRPDKLNAMSTRMKGEILDALEKFETDAAVRVAVFTGQGDKAFVAGGENNKLAYPAAPGERVTFHTRFPRCMASLRSYHL